MINERFPDTEELDHERYGDADALAHEGFPVHSGDTIFVPTDATARTHLMFPSSLNEGLIDEIYRGEQ